MMSQGMPSGLRTATEARRWGAGLARRGLMRILVVCLVLGVAGVAPHSTHAAREKVLSRTGGKVSWRGPTKRLLGKMARGSLSMLIGVGLLLPGAVAAGVDGKAGSPVDTSTGAMLVALKALHKKYPYGEKSVAMERYRQVSSQFGDLLSQTAPYASPGKDGATHYVAFVPGSGGKGAFAETPGVVGGVKVTPDPVGAAAAYRRQVDAGVLAVVRAASKVLQIGMPEDKNRVLEDLAGRVLGIRVKTLVPTGAGSEVVTKTKTLEPFAAGNLARIFSSLGVERELAQYEASNQWL